MDQNFLQEELRNDYKVSKEIKQLWAVELDLIERFKDVCERNHLKYFIAGGTLLGAVRHQGFIPWDDDVDFLMPREDFEILKKIAPIEFKEPYFLQTEESDPDIFLGGYAKLRNSNTTMFENIHINHNANFGVWIDIFILDYIHEDLKKGKKQVNKVRYLQKLIYAKNYSEYKRFLKLSIVQWMLYKILAAFCNRAWLCNQLLKALTCCKTSNYLSCLNYNSNWSCPPRFNKEDFRGSTQLDFEYLQLPAPIGYGSILKSLYGDDYLKYPPPEQRKPHHKVILETDISYRSYLIKFERTLENIKGTTIVIFGAGKMLEHYLNHKGKKYPPKFIVDNDEKKWKTSVHGIPVKQPHSVLTVPRDNLCLLICSIHYREIAKQLRSMGIDKYYIYVQEIDWL